MSESNNTERTLFDEMAEARAVQAEGNIGRARTCARRAAGMAMRETIGIGPGARNYATTFINGLYRMAKDAALPEEVRAAAARLVDRSKPDRTSAAITPVQDAEIILNYLGLNNAAVSS